MQAYVSTTMKQSAQNSAANYHDPLENQP